MTNKAFEELTIKEQEFCIKNYVGEVVKVNLEVEGLEIPDGIEEVLKNLDEVEARENWRKECLF